MKRIAVTMLFVCLLAVSFVASAFVSAEETLQQTSPRSRVGNAIGTGTLVFEFNEEDSSLKIRARSLPARFPSYVQQVVDSNGDAFIFNHRTQTLYVYDKDEELKLSKDVELGTSNEQADWRIALSGRYLWLWSREQQQFVKLDKASLEQVELIDDFTNATGTVQLAGGTKDDLYVWAAPYIWRLHDGRLARVDLRQFYVTSENVALTIANDGLVYAVDPATAQIFVFDAELEEGKAYKLADFDGTAPLEIYIWRERVYLHDADSMLWRYFRPSL